MPGSAERLIVTKNDDETIVRSALDALLLHAPSLTAEIEQCIPENSTKAQRAEYRVAMARAALCESADYAGVPVLELARQILLLQELETRSVH